MSLRRHREPQPPREIEHVIDRDERAIRAQETAAALMHNALEEVRRAIEDLQQEQGERRNGTTPE